MEGNKLAPILQEYEDYVFHILLHNFEWLVASVIGQPYRIPEACESIYRQYALLTGQDITVVRQPIIVAAKGQEGGIIPDMGGTSLGETLRLMLVAPDLCLTHAHPAVQQGEECPICLDTFSPLDPVYQLHCRHIFHPLCVQQWLYGQKASCPVCRSGLLLQYTPTLHDPPEDCPAIRGCGSPGGRLFCLHVSYPTTT